MLEEKDCRMVFSILFGFNDRLTRYAMSSRMTTLHVIYSSKMSRVSLFNRSQECTSK